MTRKHVLMVYILYVHISVCIKGLKVGYLMENGMCVGPAAPCDRGQSAHLCSHLLRRGRTDIKSLLQALPAHSDCAHGCQGECTAIGSSRLPFSSARPPERTIKKTKLLSLALTKLTDHLVPEYLEKSTGCYNKLSLYVLVPFLPGWRNITDAGNVKWPEKKFNLSQVRWRNL